MSAKIFLYLAVSPAVIYAMSSLNINGIFKKNSIMAARLFYYLIGLIMIFLVTNCLYDIFLSMQ